MPNVFLGGDYLDEVVEFCYLGSHGSYCGRMSNEISPLTQKARLAFISLRYLWSQHGIRLLTKDWVYTRAVLLYGSKIWLLRAKARWRLSAFAHRRFFIASRILWDNSQVNSWRLDHSHSIGWILNSIRLRWLRHVPHMSAGCLLYASLSWTGTGWDIGSDDQRMTPWKYPKALTKVLSLVDWAEIAGFIFVRLLLDFWRP